MTPVRIPPRSFLVVANGQKWGTGVKCTSSQSEIQYRLYIWRTTGKSVVNKPKKKEWLQMCKKKMQTICFCGAGVGSSYMASKIVLYDVWGVLKGNLCPIRGSKMGQEVGAKQRIVEMLKKKKKHGKKTLKKKKSIGQPNKMFECQRYLNAFLIILGYWVQKWHPFLWIGLTLWDILFWTMNKLIFNVLWPLTKCILIICALTPPHFAFQRLLLLIFQSQK